MPYYVKITNLYSHIIDVIHSDINEDENLFWNMIIQDQTQFAKKSLVN